MAEPSAPHPPGQPSRHRSRRVLLLLGSGAVLGAALAGAAAFALLSDRPSPSSRAALEDDPGETRPVVGRLLGSSAAPPSHLPYTDAASASELARCQTSADCSPSARSWSSAFTETRRRNDLHLVGRQAPSESRRRGSGIHFASGRTDWIAPPPLEPSLENPGELRRLNDDAVWFLDRALADPDPFGLERMRHGAGAHERLELALEAFEPALGADRSPPAHLRDLYHALRFNRALALEALGRRELADQALARIVREEPDPAWRAEAEDLRRTLAADLEDAVDLPLAQCWAPLPAPGAPPGELEAWADAAPTGGDLRLWVERWPTAARLCVLDLLLPRWADELAAGRETRAALIGRKVRAVVEARGDGFRHEPTLVEEMELLEGRRGEAARARLVSAMAAFREATTPGPEVPAPEGAPETSAGDAPGDEATGKVATGKDDHDELTQALATLARQLSAAGSPRARWARYGLAVTLYNASEFEAARPVAEGLVEDLSDGLGEPPDQAPPALLGRALWLQGLILLELGTMEQALEAYQRARQVYETLEEPARVAYVDALMAETSFSLGMEELSWHHISRALEKLSTVHEPGRRLIILQTLMFIVDDVGLPRAGLAAVDEWTAELGDTADAATRNVAWRNQALVALGYGNLPRALRHLEAAARQVEGIGPEHRASTLGDLAYVEGRLALAAGDPERAIESFERGLRLQKDGQLFRPQLLYWLARAYRTESRPGEAEEVLARASDELEGQREELRDTATRLAHFGNLRAVYGALVDLMAEQGRPVEALIQEERGRGRDLLDRLAVHGRRAEAPEPSWPGLRSPLPQGTTVLIYRVLEEEVLVLALGPEGRGEPRVVRLPLGRSGRAGLEERIARLSQGLSAFAPARALRPQLESLGEDLLGPFGDLLTSSRRLLIVPDTILWDLPFEALRAPAFPERSLVQALPIHYAPSLTVYGESVQHARQRRRAPRDLPVLTLGNPTLLDPRLDALPAAQAEAEAVAELLEGRALVGADATLESFRRLGAEAAVLHLATHGQAHREDPMLSHLVFAPPGTDAPGDDPAASPPTNPRLYAHQLFAAEGTGGSPAHPARAFGRAELVVLAACSTASGWERSGEGVGGMVRPLLALGVPSVIAARWDADDPTSLRLFDRFYQERSAGSGDAEALRAAQLELLDDDPDLSPGLWATYALYGADGGR